MLPKFIWSRRLGSMTSSGDPQRVTSALKLRTMNEIAFPWKPSDGFPMRPARGWEIVRITRECDLGANTLLSPEVGRGRFGFGTIGDERLEGIRRSSLVSDTSHFGRKGSGGDFIFDLAKCQIGLGLINLVRADSKKKRLDVRDAAALGSALLALPIC
jgi:hypothetical protein